MVCPSVSIARWLAAALPVRTTSAALASTSARRRLRRYCAAFPLALAARKPTAPVGPGQDLRLFVGDVAENLEGSNCDPRLIGRLEEGLGSIPLE